MSRTLTVILIFFAPLVRADHFSGSSITYECIGGGQYKIFLDLYLDCAGAAMIPQNLKFTSSCGSNFTLFNLIPVSNTEFSPVCPEMLSSTSCNGGTLPGFRHHHFEVTTFLSPCSLWTISWSICCRNTMVNIQDLPGLYVKATLNTSGGFCDNSPVFTNTGVPFVCVNSPASYNPGVVDADGHTLSYAFVSAQYATPSIGNVTYASGYSASQPIPGITLNANTGQMEFTPTVAGNYTVVLQVSSYKADGSLIGKVMNDLMFIVPTCDGTAPSFDGLTNAVNGLVIAPNELAVCVGNLACVDIVFSDDDPASAISLITNAADILPGSTLQTTGTNPLYATLCWPVTEENFPMNLFIQASDGDCPISNYSSTYLIAQECIPLAVELLSFEASSVEDHIELQWSTASEWNNEHFQVHRSGDGEAFETLTIMDGAGTHQGITKYHYIDREPLYGTNYYRLQQVDVDGTTSFSEILSVTSNGRSGLSFIADGNGGWQVIGARGSARWLLVDVIGRIRASGESDDQGSISLPAAIVSKGIQLILIESGDRHLAQKLPIPPFGVPY